jgi:hypothetical protein
MANVGFHIHYHDRDQTHVALSMATQLIKCGHDVSFLSRGTRAKKVNVEFDSKILSHQKTMFWNWALTKDLVIWTDLPSAGPLLYANNHGVKTAIVGFWEEVSKESAKYYREADYAVFPILQAALNFKKLFKLKRSIYWPYVPTIPFTQKTFTNSKTLRVLFPVCGTQTSTVMMDTLQMISELLCNADDIEVTCLISKRFSKLALTELKRTAKKHPNLKIRIDYDWQQQIQEYFQTDLVIRSCVFDGSGLIYLNAAYSGTPVFTFDAAPVREFLGTKVKSVKVDCESKYDSLNVPMVDPDYAKVSSQLISLVNNREKIKKMTNCDISADCAGHESIANEALEAIVNSKTEGTK